MAGLKETWPVDGESRFLSLEEIEKLPVYLEPESESAGTIRDDGGGAYAAKGYVYLMQEESTDSAGPIYFKVGMTGNLKSRLSNLQTGNARKLQMCCETVKVNNMSLAEGDLKQTMWKYKCVLGGGTEWFTVQLSQVDNFKGLFTQTVHRYRM